MATSSGWWWSTKIFGKTDEDFSQQALDLFKQLDLQLVIVNPFDAKSRIVEEYGHSSARDDTSNSNAAPDKPQGVEGQTPNTTTTARCPWSRSGSSCTRPICSPANIINGQA
jgi:hypothetical protein